MYERNSSQTDDGRIDRGCIRTFDWAETTPSDAVLEAVATVRDCTKSELNVLYDYVEPDALDTLFESHDGEILNVTFGFGRFRVTVREDGTVFVEPEE